MGLAWAWSTGWVEDMFSHDASYMTYVAAVLLLIGTISIFLRANKVCIALNKIKAGKHVAVNGVKFTEKNAHLGDLGDIIVTVGLTGTAIGVVMMLHAFNAGSLADSAKVVQTATALGEGVGTAFRSTIVSAIAWMWHLVNYRMLRTATVLMIEDSWDTTDR
jgi:hypothetical protein